MIDSVLYQTYENWQLCLADGSDAAHAYVEKICAEYIAKEGARNRIAYRYPRHPLCCGEPESYSTYLFSAASESLTD